MYGLCVFVRQWVLVLSCINSVVWIGRVTEVCVLNDATGVYTVCMLCRHPLVFVSHQMESIGNRAVWAAYKVAWQDEGLPSTIFASLMKLRYVFT
jgi:hypothetical protein